MKSLTRTIVVFAILSLAMGTFALAEKASPEARTVTISGSVGLSGVMLRGLPGNPVTGWPGTYKATVDYGWSGTVTPVKAGYIFDPPSRIYSKVTKDYYSQDYTARLITFTISGTTGIGGVVMDGLPGNPVSDERGYYSATVSYGWKGTVTPTKEGYKFEPASKTYTEVTHDKTNQNYAVELITLTISGEVGVGGVLMRGLPGNPVVTGRNGTYQATVKYGWSGTVTPTKKGYAFEPPNLSYSRVTRDQNNQSYNPKRICPAPMLGRTGGRKVLVIPDSDVKPEELNAITQDLQVMSHIFDEKFREPRTIKGVFTDFGDFFGRDSRATEAIYLQGYGVLFLMEVNFTFSPPPKAQEKESKKTEEDVDPTWQRAKQKIFSPRGLGGASEFVSEERYSAEKFDQLKKELIETLKHAANIRNLKPDEWVILTVIGHGRQPGEFYEDYYRSAAPRSNYSSSYSTSSQSSSSEGGGYAASRSSGVAGGYGGMGGYHMGGMGSYGKMGLPSTTILTIRAKKSDVDEFAKYDDFEVFSKKMQIFTY